MWHVAAWRAVPTMAHGFLGRAESPPNGRWADAVEAAGHPGPLVLPRQVHGTTVARVAAPGDVGDADAVVASSGDVVVGVVTADCVPILLRTRNGAGVAAVHAGWRGAAAGVVERAVEVLCGVAATTPAEIEAAIGPAVGPCCYRVGPEVRETFQRRTGETTALAWTRDGDRYRLDLRTAVTLLLAGAGVRTIATVGPCTSCSLELHSYRRDAVAAGRQLSFIGLR
jgi:polyphenol oxidase